MSEPIEEEQEINAEDEQNFVAAVFDVTVPTENYADRWFVYQDGTYAGALSGPPDMVSPYPDSVEVQAAPADGRDVWNFQTNAWVPHAGDPDIPGFFNALVMNIVGGAIPGDVHGKAKMILDLTDPAVQAQAMAAFSNGVDSATGQPYTTPQKVALNNLIQAFHLALPTLPV